MKINNKTVGLITAIMMASMVMAGGSIWTDDHPSNIRRY